MSTDPFLEPALTHALSLLRSGQVDAACAAYRAISERLPGESAAHFMLGIGLAQKRDYPSAIASLERAFALAPAQPAGNQLAFANVLMDAGQVDRGQRHAREALRIAPGWPPALNALGFSLHLQGRLEDAISAYSAAIAANDTYVHARRNLAAALMDAGRNDDALAELRRVVALDQGDAGSHWRIGRLLDGKSQVFDAIDEYRRAIALGAGEPDLFCDLGNSLANAGAASEAQEAYRETLRRRPGYHQVESNLLVNLHYDPTFGAHAIFQAHRDWAARHAAHLSPATPPAPRKLRDGEKLRVGFLSPALRSGPTGTFVAPVFEHLDRERFEVFAYNANGRRDEASERLQRLCDRWHDAWTEEDDALAGRILEDRLDVLIDLAGHTPGGRLLALARKPAPVIATWLDYFDTTGVKAVDYLIGDSVSTPVGGSQLFTEEVVRLEPCRFCYSPPPYAPQVAAAPALRNGYVTFGSFNRLSKMVPAVFESWSRVLAAVPSSRLLLKNAAFTDERTRARVAEAFARHGIGAERIELRAHSSHPQMLAEYGEVDIALDPFPFNGGLTTCEALWMGVPVLALLGDSMISRQSASILHAAGLQDWVAAEGEDFVRRAVDVSSRLEMLGRLRGEMRSRLAATPLLDAPRFATAFGNLLDAMAQRTTIR